MLKKSCAIAGPVQTLMMKGELAKANINARLGNEEESAMMISSVKNMPLFIRIEHPTDGTCIRASRRLERLRRFERNYMPP